MSKTEELEKQLTAANERIAHLEAQQTSSVPYVGLMTDYQKFIAGGGTHKGWVRRERRLAREHWRP